jgi:hypothetical protein
LSARGASRFAAAALVACLIALAAPAAASAVVYVVNVTGDVGGACPATCSLRAAVAAAGPTDSITLPAGTYVLSQGELSLAGDTINGAGARSTIIDGNNASRVMSTSNSDTTASSISGVTIRAGNGVGGQFPGEGGGIWVTGTLGVNNSHIVGNTATTGGGIFVESGSNLVLVGSTVAGNVATSSTGGRGGGIYGENENQVFFVINSTITGNAARSTGSIIPQGGGIFAGGGSRLNLSNATVASNEVTASNGGGIYVTSGEFTTLANTVLADNAGGACGGDVSAIPTASQHNLVTDGSCTLTGPGNLQGVASQLGDLANNGGPTDTRALAATSPAINAGSGCAISDQRGVARPQGAACDIGAYEYRAPVLTVTTTVVNDHGFSDFPADFTVRVRTNGADVPGSPQPGSAGTTYTLAPGAYLVSADARRRYTLAAGGSCAADGSISLAEGQVAACTIVANDPSPPDNGVNGRPVRGTVRIKLPGRKKFRQLKEGEQLPNGTTVDTLKGRIRLFAAADKKGNTKSGDFYDGVFKIRQGKGSKPITTLTLVEKLSCKATSAKASAAAKKKRKRRLWGNGSGKFRTKGKHSAATVVGTKWLVEDRCKSTLTRVVRGRVSVRDFAKKKTVLVRKGKRYIARARS